MSSSSLERRRFLRNSLGLVVVACGSPRTVLGRLTPTLSVTESGSILATYILHLADYPTLDSVGGSVKLTQPNLLQLNPDHRYYGSTAKPFPIAVTRVAEAGTDAFVAVSTYCTHGAGYQLRDYDPINGVFVCPHQGSTFKADGTHVVVSRTPNVGNLRKFTATYDEAAGTITLGNVLQIAGIEQHAGGENGLFLAPCLPNPVTSSATFSYGLPARCAVHLALYGMNGTVARQIVEETQEAGVHSADFNADGLPSGTYFFRLATSFGTLTQQVEIVR
ncbi:MAG: Rieske 2Fe-2S domain-containing protein [Bacteroidetes bacterium]|nr:Rieske 2Fe-2S domain-containing protein [Bacteroidota bacterium]